MRQYQKQKIRGSSCKGKERSESTGQSSAVTQEERATAQDLEKKQQTWTNSWNVSRLSVDWQRI